MTTSLNCFITDLIKLL